MSPFKAFFHPCSRSKRAKTSWGWWRLRAELIQQELLWHLRWFLRLHDANRERFVYQLVSKLGWVLATSCSGGLHPLRGELSLGKWGMLMVVALDLRCLVIRWCDALRPSCMVYAFNDYKAYWNFWCATPGENTWCSFIGKMVGLNESAPIIGDEDTTGILFEGLECNFYSFQECLCKL